MKKFTKASLLLATIALTLTSCEEYKKKAYCVETSTTVDYVSGKCFQISVYDVLEVFYIITNPINPEANPEDYEYKFTWNLDLKNAYFEFVDGLEGKNIVSAFKVSDNIIKINVKGRCKNYKATSGNLMIYRYAFTSNSDETKDASLYAYLSAGETGSFLVDKPNNNE